MKNSFSEEFTRERALRAAYHEADKAHDEERISAIRDEHRALMASIDAKGKDYAHLYSLYEEAQERGNESIDLSEVIWDDKVEGLIASFRAYGIERFTFSSGWSSAVETAWLFTQQGCTLEGLVEINGHCKAFMSDDYEKAHAYAFRVN